MPEPTTPETPLAAAVPPVVTPAEQRRRDLVEEYELPDDNPKPITPAAPKTAAPAAPASETPPRHSRRLVQMAQDLGFSRADIDGSSSDELDAAVYHANRALHVERERQYRETAQQAATAPRTGAAPPPSEDDLPWGEIVDPTTQERRAAKDADIAEPLVRVLRDQAKAIKELREQVAYLGQTEQRREVETTADRIDRFFAGQDKATFGEGAGQEMADGPEYARRVAVLREAERLAGPKATKAQMLAKLNQASKNLFGTAAPAAPIPPSAPPPDRTREANGRFTQEQERWIEAGVAKPTHRAGAEEPLGKQRAINKLTSLMNEAGIEVGADNALERELHDELPD